MRMLLAASLVALCPTLASAQCQLQCSVTAESHAIALSCESGAISEKVSDQTSFEYTPSGSVGVLTLTLNRERTYIASKRTYHLSGTIRVDKTSGTQSYDIRATGGLLGGNTATCKAGDVAAPAPRPAQPAATAAHDPPPPRAHKLSLGVSADYQPAIAIPACLDALKKNVALVACVVGEPREYISQGKTWRLAPRDPPASARLFFGRVEVGIPDGKQSWESWQLQFSPPQGTPWRTGLYENAVRNGSEDATHAGLAVRAHSSGCSEVAGQFEILELVTDAAAETVEKLAVNFEQVCDKSGRRLQGLVRFNSAIGR